MNTITCQDCGTEVVRGQAHIRSVKLEQRGWCRRCWAIRQGDVVPLPRTDAYPKNVPIPQTRAGGRAYK